MKRVLVILLSLVFLMVSVSFAGDNEKESWWQQLKSKIEKIKPKRDITVTTAAGGVRGAKDESFDTLYWKGKDEAVSEEEFNKFNLALEYALSGDNEKALESFEEFLEGYPQSPLRQDAEKAITHLKAAR